MENLAQTELLSPMVRQNLSNRCSGSPGFEDPFERLGNLNPDRVFFRSEPQKRRQRLLAIAIVPAVDIAIDLLRDLIASKAFRYKRVSVRRHRFRVL
jgi:hypothetical protein